MSKLDEKQIEKTHKSAAGQEDKAFEEWVSQRVLDETAEMINGLENDPDLDDFEPSEELFQKIVGIAKERGLLAEDDETTDDEADDENAEMLEFANFSRETEIPQVIQKLQSNNQGYKEKVNKNFICRRNVMKWAAMIAVTLLGVFGVSMSSQANRTFVMQKMNQVLGNDMDTVINNTSDILKSDTTEEQDRQIIEETLSISIPDLFYLPDNVKYWGYEMDKGSQSSYIQYSYNDESLFLIAVANPKDASGIYRNDYGSKIDI
ncbi:MAG: hypothetical protein ACOYBI_03985, partial [Blautia sp.]|uniref:hypothetical protein n=1 Tax=Blautia sp. TaxID=1955243 RepID=UPI003D90773A